MKTILNLAAVYLLLLLIPLSANTQPAINTYTVMFYNVENLFDTENDSLKNDGEFTPEGSKKWNHYRYNKKLRQIYKVMIAAGEWNPPAIVGLAEIENEKVLREMINFTPLKKLNYWYVHEESTDARGIDVALLYRRDIFKYIHHEARKVDLESPARDILVVSGIFQEDTCHFIVNHWPSRIGGKSHTNNLRLAASAALVSAIDSLAQLYCEPKIVVMGDFNDGPEDESILRLRSDKYVSGCGVGFSMINLMDNPKNEKGTLVYTDAFRNWYTFDQILVSGFLIEGRAISTRREPGRIFSADWLLNDSGAPNRTYLGDYYQGGFSDHLPVYIRLYAGKVK